MRSLKRASVPQIEIYPFSFLSSILVGYGLQWLLSVHVISVLESVIVQMEQLLIYKILLFPLPLELQKASSHNRYILA